MAASLMQVDPDDLGTVSDSFNQAASQFASAKSQFVSSGSPNFGILLSFVKPFYGIAKDSTVSYLGNIESMLNSISSAVEGTAKDTKATEQSNKELLNKIIQLLEEIRDNQNKNNNESSVDPGMPEAPVAGAVVSEAVPVRAVLAVALARAVELAPARIPASTSRCNRLLNRRRRRRPHQQRSQVTIKM